MTKDELCRVLVHYAEEVRELHTVLSADLPKDNDGFVIHDGSDLSDALRKLDQMAIALPRIVYRLNNDDD